MSEDDDLHARIGDQRDRPFLKAAMAASALAAQADGTVTLSERASVEQILATLRTLKIHDTHKALAILRGYLAELRRNPEIAEAVLLGKLERIAENRPAADLVARIALQVSRADGQFSVEEKHQFGRICRALRVHPEDIDPSWA